MEPKLLTDVFHQFASTKSSSVNLLILFETAIHFEIPVYLSFKYNVSKMLRCHFSKTLKFFEFSGH